MRLARVGERGYERPAMVDHDNCLRGLSSMIDDISPSTSAPSKLRRQAEVDDPNALRLWTEVNGIMHQDGKTTDPIFDVTTSIAYISAFMTLEPGDLILTDTPAGVGKGYEPNSIYLQVGNHFRCGVEGLGVQSHQMIEGQP